MSIIGLVIKSTGSWYKVRYNNGKTILCKVKGKLRLKEAQTTNPITVGDIVDISIVDDKTGVIEKIYERKNYIIRRSVNLSRKAHIIAANIDQALLLVTIILPETTTTFIDRFLVAAEAYRIPTKIIFNKIDIYDEELMQEVHRLKDIYTKIGYECYEVSAAKGTNLEQLKTLMHNKSSLISGNSGVGKSTLINAIDPTLELRIGEISSFHHKGKHTTTFSEMFELEFGGYIIDTPGIKSFGMVDMEKKELAHYFPEMFAYLDKCQYYNCIHIYEPNCAVKVALEEGKIAPSRYISYLSLLDEDENKYRAAQ